MFDKPFISVEINVDAEGNGPCEDKDMVKIIYEVWDTTFKTVCKAESKEICDWIVAKLNKGE